MHAAFGSNPADIQAGIGPSIGPERYQGARKWWMPCARRSARPMVVSPRGGRSAYLNCGRRTGWRWARGVGQIEIAGICTATRIDEFYSHRAERGRTGRLAR